MADVVWPASLPQEPLLAGEQQDLGEQVIRTPMDIGPDKVRSRTTAAVDTFAIALWLDADQYIAFLTFYRTSINGGALAFLWKNPLTGNPADLRIVGQPRIVPGSSRSSTQRKFKVTFGVELMPGSEVSGGSPPEAPQNRAGGGAGVGGSGELDADGLEAIGSGGEAFEPAVEWFLPFEADTAPPALLIELISGFGSGFDDEGQTASSEAEALSGAAGGSGDGGGTNPGHSDSDTGGFGAA